MRNAVAHSYFKVDYEIVWKTIQADLPGLHGRVRPVIATLDSAVVLADSSATSISAYGIRDGIEFGMRKKTMLDRRFGKSIDMRAGLCLQ